LKATTDEVAWCAAFVNWCLVSAGKKGCNSARAILRPIRTVGEVELEFAMFTREAFIPADCSGGG
jgi:hypothetical protein